MRKVKIITVVAVAAVLVLGIAACGLRSVDDEDDTIGERYVSAFRSSEETDPAKMAEDLVDLKIFNIAMDRVDVNEGYLDGFDTEITGFSKGTRFAPYISSIPFVGYVFETDDAQALLDQLNAAADTRWNICTEADEVVSASRDRLVFFLMCINEE